MRSSSQSIKFIYRTFYILIVIHSSEALAATTAVSDEHIRQIVESLLKEKDQKIEQLEARILQMERDRQKPAANTAVISAPETVAGNGKPQTPVKAQTTEETEEKHVAITTKLLDLGEKGEELKEAAKDKGLDISGFFDVNAKTDNATDQTFSVGSIELDLEYSYNELLAPTPANQLGKSLSCLVN